ncbi:phage holin family protein [Streptomyces sp. NPDC090306]|uniref:phage holin family protein n=1 Tax=unclassified Streptomyces TaxID=2593676 RepID=UPI0036E5A410
MALPSSEQNPLPTHPDGTGPGPVPGDPSLGDLISDISDDLSQLVRNEIALAKAELKQESVKAGKAGGMLAGAGYAGHIVVLFVSLTALFALDAGMDLAWAALIVTAVWAIAAAVLYVNGRKRLRAVSMKPDQTVETLKEDAAWARKPTG